MKLTSSASFSPSIRISLRLKIHQAQAKNFCRVLDIRVPQVVNSNALYAGVFAAALHLTIKIAFRDWKQPVIQTNVILHLQILLDFVCQKARHSDGAVALFRLGRCDDVFSTSALECLVDCDCAFVKVKVCRC